MKTEALPPGKKMGPRFILRPQTHEETRFLTILRDLCLATGARIKLTGAEELPKSIRGIPPKPVSGISIEVVLPEGMDVDHSNLDPSKVCEQEVIVTRPNPKKIKVSKQGENNLVIDQGE